MKKRLSAKGKGGHVDTGSTPKKKVFTLKRCVIALIVIAGFTMMLSVIPVSYARSEEAPLQYSTESKDEASLELGTEQTIQEGKAGLERQNYTYTGSMFDFIFRKDNFSKTLFSSRVITKPTNKVVLTGLRKWQYMMCSNGRYRYYTDEQFKSRTVGFTSKSPDYCEQNNEGKKIGLADSPSGQNNPVKPSYTPTGCTYSVIPYNTVYKDASWLNLGQTQEGYGSNGSRIICPDSKYNFTLNPIDKTIYRGTYSPTTYSPPTTTYPTQDYAAKSRCDSDYARAKAQIIAGNGGNSSAMTQLQYAYSQCLRNAGF